MHVLQKVLTLTVFSILPSFVMAETVVKEASKEGEEVAAADE